MKDDKFFDEGEELISLAEEIYLIIHDQYGSQDSFPKSYDPKDYNDPSLASMPDILKDKGIGTNYSAINEFVEKFSLTIYFAIEDGAAEATFYRDGGDDHPDLPPRIVLSHKRLSYKDNLLKDLAHELRHAYDYFSDNLQKPVLSEYTKEYFQQPHEQRAYFTQLMIEKDKFYSDHPSKTTLFPLIDVIDKFRKEYEHDLFKHCNDWYTEKLTEYWNYLNQKK